MQKVSKHQVAAPTIETYRNVTVHAAKLEAELMQLISPEQSRDRLRARHNAENLSKYLRLCEHNFGKLTRRPYHLRAHTGKGWWYLTLSPAVRHISHTTGRHRDLAWQELDMGDRDIVSLHLLHGMSMHSVLRT